MNSCCSPCVAKIRSRRKRLHDEIVYDQLHHHHQQQQQQLQQHGMALVRTSVAAVNGHRDAAAAAAAAGYPQQCPVRSYVILTRIVHMNTFVTNY